MNASLQPEREVFAAAAVRFFPDATTVIPVAESNSIAKIETPSGSFALRRWPAGTTPERIEYVHSVLLRLSDLVLVPKVARVNGESIVRTGQELFDAVTWLDGKPLRRPELPAGLQSPVSLPHAARVELIQELATAVARVHVSTRSLAKNRSTPKLAVRGLVAGVRASWMQQRGRLRPIARLTPDIQRWLRTGERALPLAERIISGLPEDSLTDLVVAHANLWPEHVLVVRHGRVDRLSGIIDFKQVVATTPLLDLAQIAGRFNGWSDESAEVVIGGYVDAGHLMPPERRALPAIAALDLVAESGRILVAAYVELGLSRAPESMRDAADSMLRSLETATRTMERLEGINQPGPRKWVHRQPRPGESKPSKASTRPPKRPKGSLRQTN